MPEPQTLNKKNFSINFDKKEKKFTINIKAKKLDYHLVLVARDGNSDFIAKHKTFKNGNANLTEINSPIFYLVYPAEISSAHAKYFEAEINRLIREMNLMKSEIGSDFYNAELKKLLVKLSLNLNKYCHEIPAREIFLGLLEPFNVFIDFNELPKEIENKKKILSDLTKEYEKLEEIKDKLLIFTNNVFDSKNKNQYSELLKKLELLLADFNELITNEENFLHIPIIATDKQRLATLNDTIASIYVQKEDILQEYEQNLTERNNFVTNAIEKLTLFKLELKKTLFADDILIKIEEEELFNEKLSVCESMLKKFQENLLSISEAGYNKRKNIYTNFYRDLREKLAAYKQISYEIVFARKTGLSTEKNKLIDENKLDAFKQTLADEVVFEFEKHPIYIKYTELLAEINKELIDGCLSLQKIEGLKNEIAILSPQLATLKKDYELKNQQVILARKRAIATMQSELAEIEINLTEVSKELYEITTNEFPSTELINQLKNLKSETKNLTEDNFLCLNKENLDSLRKKFASFKAAFELKISATNQQSAENIRAKLQLIQRDTTTLKNTHFSEKLKALLANPSLKRSELEGIMAELLNLKKDKIKAVNEERLRIEEKITLFAADLYGSAIEPFEKEAFATQLAPIKQQLTQLSIDDAYLSEYPFDSIDVEFKKFVTHYETKIEEISTESKQAIKTKLSELNESPITQENREFLKKIDLLLSDQAPIKSKLEPIIEEFNSLRLNSFSIKLDSVAEKINTHLKKLQGENLNWREKLVKLLFKKITKEKIEFEQKGISALNEIKNYIANASASSTNDANRLTELYQTANTIFQENIFTKSRNCLFFKFNPVTSGQIASETTELLAELKTAFKI